MKIKDFKIYDIIKSHAGDLFIVVEKKEIINKKHKSINALKVIEKGKYLYNRLFKTDENTNFEFVRRATGNEIKTFK